MAPPSTPAPSRFLVSKRRPPSASQNGEQQQQQQQQQQAPTSGPPKFRATPRFSAPSSTPTPSVVAGGFTFASSSRSGRGRFSTQDLIDDSSPPELSDREATGASESRAKRMDPIHVDLHSSPASGSPIDSSESESEDERKHEGEREPKRRRISISPDEHVVSSSPVGIPEDEQSVLGDSSPVHEEIQESDEGPVREEIQGFDEGAEQPDHHDIDDEDPQLTQDVIPYTTYYDDSDSPISDQHDEASTGIPPDHACSPAHSSDSQDSSSSAVDFLPDETKHRPSGHHPTFYKAPRFKEPGATTDYDESGRVRGRLHALPDAFSPQRRGAKYVPGGLAAELRDWLIEVKGYDGVGNGGGSEVPGVLGPAVGLVVHGVRRGGPGMVLVQGRAVSPEGHAADREGPACHAVKAVLAGDGRVSGLDRPKKVTAGCRVLVSPPAWDVDMGSRLERWTIACDWAVSE